MKNYTQKEVREMRREAEKVARDELKQILIFPCPNKVWHHLGTKCKVCGQVG